MGLTLKHPDVNEGERMFTVNREGEIIYGLGAVKGLGEGPVDSLCQAREGGPFTDLFDFCARTDPGRANRAAIDALIRSGAFDSLGEERALLMASLDDALLAAQQRADNAAAGIDDLFGADNDPVAAADVYADHRSVRAWSRKETLAHERDALGLWLSGHPFEVHEDELREVGLPRIADLSADGSRPRTIAGLVADMRIMKTRRGSMAVLVVDDRSGLIEVTLFGEAYGKYRELLVKDGDTRPGGRGRPRRLQRQAGHEGEHGARPRPGAPGLPRGAVHPVAGGHLPGPGGRDSPPAGAGAQRPLPGVISLLPDAQPRPDPRRGQLARRAQPTT